MSKFSSTVVFVLVCSSLTGCNFAPSYIKPEIVDMPVKYKELGDWKPAQPADEQSRGAWWHQFHDSQLDIFEEKVGSANQNIKAALAALEQARADTRLVAADLIPKVSGGPAITRTRTSVDSPHYISKSEPVANDFQLTADFSYELDVWGRVRNEVSSAKANQQANTADFATLDLSIHAELATDYFTLRVNDAQQQLLDQTVTDYEKALLLTRNLYLGGARPLSDVAQAKALLESARVQQADIRLLRANVEHAIAVLLGENPSEFHIEPNPLPSDTLPPVFDAGLPSTLLERRPDIAAAERRVEVANAQIGVARAAYFPVFSLSGLFGFESSRTSNWLRAPSNTWSFGPSAISTLFDSGRRDAQTAKARAAFDEEVANYRNTALIAFQQVEDNLAALRQLQQESASVMAAAKATEIALRQVNYRYRGGLVTYLEVVSMENTFLQTQLVACAIQLRRLNASVLLIKALGGGWQNEEIVLQ